MATALPASTQPTTTATGSKGKGKSIWEMDQDDFDDDFDEDSAEEEDESENEDTTMEEGPMVIAFSEPRLGGSTADTPLVASSSKEMRQFMVCFSTFLSIFYQNNTKTSFPQSSKVRTGRQTYSVADEINSKLKGKSKSLPQTTLDAEEESFVPPPLSISLLSLPDPYSSHNSHLSTLDTHLASLIRPLSSATPSTTTLPSLLSSLPLSPTKTLKGHHPLPKNVPRTLRRGQLAVNLKRAQSRDLNAGVTAGQTKGLGGGREASTLKEMRRDKNGGEKRERGLGGAVGKMVGAELRISKKDVERINGSGGGGGRGGRGGKSSRGASRGGGSGGRGK